MEGKEALAPHEASVDSLMKGGQQGHENLLEQPVCRQTWGFAGGAARVPGKLDHWDTETVSFSPKTTILRGKLKLFKIKNQIYLNTFT